MKTVEKLIEGRIDLVRCSLVKMAAVVLARLYVRVLATATVFATLAIYP